MNRICNIFLPVTLLSFNLIFATPQTSQQSQRNEYFYKNPTCENLQNNIAIASEDKNEHDDMLVIFSTIALKEHPECIKIIIDNFNSYSSKQKQIYITALSGLNKPDVVNELSRYNVQVNKKIIFNPESIEAMKVNDSEKNLDILWAAYNVTGNVKYPEEIAKYLSSKDKFLLAVSAEMVNRNYICSIAQKAKLSGGCMGYDDLINAVQKRYFCGKYIAFNMMVPVAAAMWSMTENEEADPSLKEAMNEFFKKNQQFDYRTGP